MASAGSTDTVVATVGRTTGTIVRHDLGSGIAISYLFDGDEDRPRTCQWRVIAASDVELQMAVQQLLASLAPRGVSHDTQRFSGSVCHITECGPSKSNAAQTVAPDCGGIT